MKKRGNNKLIVLHILFVVIFLSIPIFSSPDFDFDFSLFKIPPFIRSFTSYVFGVIIFYTNLYLIMPRFYIGHVNIKYILILVGGYLLIVFGEEWLIPHNEGFRDLNVSPERVMGRGMPRHFAMMNWFSPLFPYSAAVLMSHYVSLSNKKRKIELDKYRSDLQNLRYQLQPHFLFNSLNNIYSISITEPEKTPEYIVKLSDILRYITAIESTEKVKVEDEIKFCEQYIDWQKLRYESLSENWKIIFPEKEAMKDLKIVPIITLPLIENVFKYGVDPSNDSPIEIVFRIENGLLQFFTRNFIYKRDHENPLLYSQQIGLEKTKEKLDLLYEDNYQLETESINGEFLLKLELNLN